VVQLVARDGEPAVMLAHGVIGRGEGVVRRAHRSLRRGEVRLAVGQRRLARLEVQRPRGHLFGERAVGQRELAELLTELGESLRRGGHFLGEAALAIGGHLHARASLRLPHLPAATELARFLLSALGHARALARVGDRLGARAELLGEGCGVGVEGALTLAQLRRTCAEALGERRRLVRLARGARDAARRLRLPLQRLPRILLGEGGRVGRLEHATLARDDGLAHRVGGTRRLLTLRLERGEVAAQLGELGAPAQGSRAGRGAGEPHGAACVDERAAAFEGWT
jgi:hypothetical protein